MSNVIRRTMSIVAPVASGFAETVSSKGTNNVNGRDGGSAIMCIATTIANSSSLTWVAILNLSVTLYAATELSTITTGGIAPTRNVTATRVARAVIVLIVFVIRQGKTSRDERSNDVAGSPISGERLERRTLASAQRGQPRLL